MVISMDILSIIIFAFYFIAFLIGMISGIAILIKGNSSLNRLFYLCCVSISCWYIGVAHTIIANDYNNCFVWHNVAAIGFLSFNSFFLHFIIVLTKKKSVKIRIWFECILYIPALILIYIFALSSQFTNLLYHYIKAPLGWINIAQMNIWVVTLYSYCTLYSFVSLLLLYRWKRKCIEPSKKKQATLIFLTSFFSLFVGIIVETLYTNQVLPILHEFAPLLVLVPMSCVFHLMMKQGLFKKNIMNEELFFLDQFRTKIINYLSFAYIASGILFFISEYLQDSYIDFFRTVFFSLLLFLFGLGIQIIKRLPVNNDVSIILYSLLLSVSIPVITLRFIHYSSITIWAFPFIIIIAALLFYNSFTLILLFTTLLATQLYLWINIPTNIVIVNPSDYFARIGIFTIAICLIYYVNKIYLIRLKQLSEKMNFQNLIGNISSSIINANYLFVKDKIVEILKIICDYLNADRAHIYFMPMEEEMFSSYYWCKEEISNFIILDDTGIASYPWWQNQITENGVINIPNVLKLPNSARNEKEFLTKQGVKAMLAVPLSSSGKILGYLRIDNIHAQRSWDLETIKVFQIIGNILGEATIKINSEKRIHMMAYYDQLTNIPNRQFFGDCVNEAIRNANKNNSSFGILFLDLDSFKTVNDTQGHDCGDKLLIRVANLITKCIEPTDTICRFGGDEFLILLNTMQTTTDIEIVATKIMEQFKNPFIIEDQSFYITASAGISVFPEDGMDKESLIKNADIAMYKAKNNGKNQYVFCTQTMKDEIQNTMLLTNSLYHALERNELTIVYQPQISIKTGEITAFEALLRWEHPDLGSISPSIFIPIAEHTGLISTIGEWVLMQSCLQNKYWQDMGLPHLRLAVNISINQLLNPNFINQVQTILTRTNLEPQYLELEITESLAIREFDTIIGVLSELKNLGVSLAIDDFGVDYSSLNRLKMLPVDRLKIDIHFIKGILENEKDKVIVDIIIKLAKDLQLKVIAEGVETNQQLQYLVYRQCDEAQGYYFNKPLTSESMQNLLLNIGCE